MSEINKPLEMKRQVAIIDEEENEKPKLSYKEYQKQYREAHKEKLNNYHRDYYSNNKDKFQKNYHCDICNCSFRKIKLSDHLKSKKHMKNRAIDFKMNTNQEDNNKKKTVIDYLMEQNRK